MAREATLRDTAVKCSKRLTCATSTAIPKHTYLKLSADNTAAASTGTGDVFIGFAHADVNNSTDTSFNTETNVTADSGAIYDLYASGAITRGALLVTAAPGNYVMAATAADVASTNRVVFAMAQEEATDGEKINCFVFPLA